MNKLIISDCIKFLFISQAVAALLKRLGWTDILVIYTDDGYGTSGYKRLLEIAGESGICISRAISIPGQGTKDDYKSLLEQIGQNSYAGAVIFGGGTQAQQVMEAASEVFSLVFFLWVLGCILVFKNFCLLLS